MYACVHVCMYKKKVKKQNNSKFDEFSLKVAFGRFGYNNLLQGFEFIKSVVKISMDVWWNKKRNEDSYQNVQLSYFWKYFLLARGVNVRVYVSAGIVFRLKFASRTGHFRAEGAGGTSGLNTGWREFSLFQINWNARLTFLLSWVTSKAKRGKHVISPKLIRFKSSLSWCVSSFGTFTSAFILFQFSRWRLYVGERLYVEECILVECTHFSLNTCGNKDIQLHQYETRVFDFWPQLLLLHVEWCLKFVRFKGYVGRW